MITPTETTNNAGSGRSPGNRIAGGRLKVYDLICLAIPRADRPVVHRRRAACKCGQPLTGNTKLCRKCNREYMRRYRASISRAATASRPVNLLQSNVAAELAGIPW